MGLEDLTDEMYFAEMKMLFQTKGWHIHMQELLAQAQQINDIQLTTDEKDLQFRKGQLAVIGTLLNFEDTIKRAEEDSNDESS